MKANHITELIGNTPHLRINKLFPEQYEVWAKLERANPGASIKDRIALSMILDAEQKGLLKQDSVIIEPTSGNTGIGLAMIGAARGYEIVLVMPDSMSVERRRIMAAYGARLELTPRENGMKGSIARAEELLGQTPGAWMPRQFENPANVNAHIEFTVSEILDDFPDGFDYLITGVGTGGHITGVGQVLKKYFPKIRVIAVEPELSAVLCGGEPGPHPIQGIGAGFVPKVLNREIIDEVISIGKDEAFHFASEAALKEGLLIGPSSGASLAAVAKKLKEIPAGSRILTFNYDTGERYLSTPGFFEAPGAE